MKPRRGEKVYKLTHAQEEIRYMWKYSIHRQSSQIPCSVAFEEDFDFRILARAVNIEIERNDCLRLRIFRDGLDIKQYFVDEYKLDRILVKEFSSKQEQEQYFDKVSSEALDVYGGETFKLIFFRTEKKSGIYIKASHMVMDFLAIFIFFKDLLSVYDSLKNGTPLPKPLAKYEEVMVKEQSDPGFKEKAEKDTRVVEEMFVKDRRAFYNALNGPKVLDWQEKLLRNKNLNMPYIHMPFNDSTHLLKLPLSDGDSKTIGDFIKANNLSPEWVIQLGFRIYFSKINRHTNDTVFWTLCPRRRTVKEKRCGGNLASILPWREILDDNATFMDSVVQLSQTQATLFRHCDVPFAQVRAMERRNFNLSLVQTACSMMFSFLPSREDFFEGRKYEFSAYNFGHYTMPIYAITMQSPSTGRFVFSYLHRTFITKDNDVYRFHDGVVRTILKGVMNPEKTIGEILEEI